MLAAEVLSRLNAYDLGRAVTVYGGGTFGIVSKVYAPGQPVDLVAVNFGQPLAVSLLVQQTGGTGDAASKCTITVKYELGPGAFFTKTFPAPLVAQSIRLFARAVYVYAQTSGQGSVQVSAGIAPEDVNPLSELVCSWVLDGSVSAGDSPVSGSGWLLDVSGSCSSLGGNTALWLFVFDPSALTIANNGLTVTAQGSGYTSVPGVTLTGGQSGAGATPATGTAVMGSSTTVTVTAGGTGYTSAPTVSASAPQLPGGVQATYTATESGGGVTGVTCTQQGSGYTSPPTLSFSGGGGSGAAATTTLSVVSLTLNNAGAGYTSAPSVGFSGGGGTGATASATITTGGQGLVPPLMITATGQFGFSDELRVKAGYVTGLTWALSGSQGGFQVPSGNPTARCDLGVGS